MSLHTVESAYHREIELSMFETELYATPAGTVSFPTSIPFSIPLLPDTPQSIQTPISSLSHRLTATFHPFDSTLPCFSRSLMIHTRRYSRHNVPLLISPETHVLDDPTRIEVQIPRATFFAGETVPLYVTVPPPERKTVVDHGLRLRNVRAELVREVKVIRDSADDEDEAMSQIRAHNGGPSAGETFLNTSLATSSSKAPMSPAYSTGVSYKVVIARSGASCRFHSSRPIQLRFVLHQPAPSSSPSDSHNLLMGTEDIDLGRMDSDADCPLITQTTLLHSVMFHIKIHVSFVDVTNRTERISVLSIPINILAPSATISGALNSIDQAYLKKHDRPPFKTSRQEDADTVVPQYSENEAGPSMQGGGGAPPPFEERDAPPPFFSLLAGASTSTRLPSFLESEREVIFSSSHLNTSTHQAPFFPGEGMEFGFHPTQQFDGHSEDMQRSSTPPPTLEMAIMDADLTSLTDMQEQNSVDVLGLVLSRRENLDEEERLPPPPPAMDDPSDPPPSIDSDFRFPELSQTSPTHTELPLDPYNASELSPQLHDPSPSPPPVVTQSHSHAPPPYLVPENDGQEHIARPPPYVD